MREKSPHDIMEGLSNSITAFFNQPHIKEMYRREAAAKALKERKEAAALAKEAAALAKAEFEKAETQKKNLAYDNWVEGGGSDECHRFGINDGCKPYCPVFEQGGCEQQEENALSWGLEE